MPPAPRPGRRDPADRFVLYGEPVRTVDPHFLHAEPIPVRSGRFDWAIGPHSHAELHQVFLVATGGGTLRLEAAIQPIRPPGLIVVPAGAVHGFAFAPGTDGWVVTVSESRLRAAAGRDAELDRLFARSRLVDGLASDAAATLAGICATLAHELAWSAPAGALAVQAEFLRLLVATLRAVGPEPGEPGDLRAADAALIDRFKRLVERDFRRGAAIAAYARALGTSEDRLLAACRRRLGEPPLRLVHRRIVLEAQRWLGGTDEPVGLVGRELGFEDPAYFSRFFRRNTGETPRAYRARVLAETFSASRT